MPRLSCAPSPAVTQTTLPMKVLVPDFQDSICGMGTSMAPGPEGLENEFPVPRRHPRNPLLDAQHHGPLLPPSSAVSLLPVLASCSQSILLTTAGPVNFKNYQAKSMVSLKPSCALPWPSRPHKDLALTTILAFLVIRYCLYLPGLYKSNLGSVSGNLLLLCLEHSRVMLL